MGDGPGADPVPAGRLPPARPAARASQPDGRVEAGAGRALPAGGAQADPAGDPRRLVRQAVRVAGVGPGPGAGRVLDLHRCESLGAAGHVPVRLQARRAADQRGPQGYPGGAGAPGVGGRVRVAPALPAGTAAGGASPGPAAARLGDVAASLPAGELSRGAPGVRAGQRLARSGLDTARSAAFSLSFVTV